MLGLDFTSTALLIGMLLILGGFEIYFYRVK